MMEISRGRDVQAAAFHRGRNRSAASGWLRANPAWLGKRVLACLCANDEGNALVELAIIMPVFLTLMTGIFSVGLAFSNQLTLTQAVGSGAQYLQQIRGSTSDPCADTFAKITAAAPYLTASKMSVTVTMNGTTPTQTGNSCSGSQTSLVEGAPVTVQATYPCNISVYGVTFASSCVLSAKVTEYEY